MLLSENSISLPCCCLFPDFGWWRDSLCRPHRGRHAFEVVTVVVFLADFGFQGFDDAVIFEFVYGIDHGDDEQGEEHYEG